MSKPLVVHVIDRLPPDGAERLIAEVLRNRSDAYDYRVLCLVEGGLLLEEIENSGVPVTVLGRRNGHDWRHAWALYRWFRQYRPKVVHTHLFTADAWGRTFAWLARVPGIFSTVHSTNAWKTPLHLRVDRLLARISDAVIACTGEVRNTIVGQGIPEAKVVSVPNGVDLQRMGAFDALDLQQAFAVPAGVPVFALVGRLHEAKGHTDLLPVLAELAAEGVPFACLFVGGGELEDTLCAQVAEQGLQNHVFFCGFRSDVPAILKSLDFLVMPSRWEGLPISLLESMACGTPVLASAVGGIPDVIESGRDGLLYPQGDAAALKQALTQLLAEPQLRQQMAEAGRHKIETQYSAAAVARAYESLYDGVRV
ncbi:glycosyltransferase [Granulosicoccaceae sp. 1_MG-2023]|nr:glycosyltransferase [Granulosicoccaceae sp. 1_MG-2023]